MASLAQKHKELARLVGARDDFLLFRGQRNGRIPYDGLLTVAGARDWSIYQSTNRPLLSTLYEPPSKQLISVLEGVGLGKGRQDRVHFHEGERFAKTPPRPVAKREVGAPVPGGGLRRCEALRLKLLGFGPQHQMPIDHVLADHHQGILRDRIVAQRVWGIRLVRQHHRGWG